MAIILIFPYIFRLFKIASDLQEEWGASSTPLYTQHQVPLWPTAYVGTVLSVTIKEPMSIYSH